MTTRLVFQEDNIDDKVQSERHKGFIWEQGRGGVILTDHNNKTNGIVSISPSKLHVPIRLILNPLEKLRSCVSLITIFVNLRLSFVSN